VKEVRLDYDTGTATVIVPDFQLSLAIGKEGQNARLAARLSGWRVDIKSETQLAEEEAYANQDWAEGEWVTDAKTGEQVWQPADGSEALSAEAWAEATEQIEAEAAGEGTTEEVSVDPDVSGDESAVSGEEAAEADVDEAVEVPEPADDAPTTPEAAIAEGAVEDPADDEPAAAPEPAPAEVPEAGDKGPVT
jgi:transcription termination/antitermination protein NusA